jgi:hypothetical protein
VMHRLMAMVMAEAQQGPGHLPWQFRAAGADQEEGRLEQPVPPHQIIKPAS